MPELATAVGYGLKPPIFQPINPASYFHWELPVQPPPKLDKAAKAAAFGSMMKVLGDLPGHLQKEYDAGRKRAVGQQVTNQFQEALKKSGPLHLSDFKANSDGSLTFSPEDPEVRAARIKHLTETGVTKPTLWDEENKHWTGDTHTEAPVSALPDSNEGEVDDSESVTSAAEPTEAGTLAGFTPTMTDAPPVAEPDAYMVDSFDRQAIEGAAMQTGKQLMGYDPMMGTADNGDSLPPAASIRPVSRDEGILTSMQAQVADAWGKAKAIHDSGDTDLAARLAARAHELESGLNAWQEIQRLSPPTDSTQPRVAMATPVKPLQGMRPGEEVQPVMSSDTAAAPSAPGELSPVRQKVLQIANDAISAGKPHPEDCGMFCQMTNALAGVPGINTRDNWKNPGFTKYSKIYGEDIGGTKPDLTTLKPGDWVIYHNGNKSDASGNHSGILLDVDPQTGNARVASGTAGKVPHVSTPNFLKQSLLRVTSPEQEGAPNGPPGGAVEDPGSEVSMAAWNSPTGSPEAPAGTPMPVRKEPGVKPAPGVAPVPAHASKKTRDSVTGIYTMETADGRKFQLLPHANSWKEVIDKSTQASALLKREAAQMGVNTDGMTNGQIGKAMEEMEKTNGIIRPSRMPVAQSLARLIVGHPTLKHYPTIREAKEALDAGMANPDTGGFGDMALVEGFQRMVNPGAVVRQGTMDNMNKAAGWMQTFDPTFQWNKAVTGDKFSPEARARIKKLADDIYNRATANARPQLNGLKKMARSYGITNPDDFVDSVLTMTPLFGTGENMSQPQPETSEQPGTKAAPAVVKPQAAAAPKAVIPRVNSQAEYDALPSGAKYYDSNGHLATKK